MKLMIRVGNHIKYVQGYLNQVITELQNRLIDHDRSKYYEDEMKCYLRFEEMPEGLVYGSPEHKAAQEKVTKDNPFPKLHFSRTDHHPEHYENISQLVFPRFRVWRRGFSMRSRCNYLILYCPSSAPGVLLTTK